MLMLYAGCSGRLYDNHTTGSKRAHSVAGVGGRAEFETWMLKRWGRERRDDDFAMGKFIYGEDYADSYTRCAWKSWSASRTAMLAAAPQEVPDGK